MSPGEHLSELPANACEEDREVDLHKLLDRLDELLLRFVPALDTVDTRAAEAVVECMTATPPQSQISPGYS